MAVEPTFTGEALLRRWSESSTQGVQVTFALSDSAELEPLKAKTGKRFMAVLVEIGDDEQPVQAEQKTAGQPENCRSSEKQQERMGDLCWRAVMWCKEPEFWNFLNLSAWGGEHVDDEDKAARRVKFLCNVGSRKDIDGNADATQRFHRHIRGPYQKHLMARGINR